MTKKQKILITVLSILTTITLFQEKETEWFAYIMTGLSTVSIINIFIWKKG